jgi:hypothetical protein
MYGNDTSRLSLDVTTFLDKRGSFESNQHYSIIKFYCSRESPIYILFYVSDRIFVIEFCRQYRFWTNLFYERKKKQSISLPWKIGEIIVRNASKINEYAIHFE